MAVITLTEANFDREVNNSALPVLVGFESAECIDSVSEQLGKKMKCCKVSSSTAPGLARRYQVHGVPTMLLFKGGQVTDTIFGAIKTEQVLKILQ
jgi:thioredoxin 1